MGFTVYVSKAGTLNASAISHGRKRCYMSGAASWVVVAYAPDSGHCELRFLSQGPLTDAEHRQVQGMQRRLVEKYAAEHGRLPRRNDPCPCKSGRKYKKCCAGLAP